MRTQFTFYESFASAIKRIRKAADRAQAYDVICDYALYEIEPDVDTMPDAVAIVFELIRPHLDSAAKMSRGGKRSQSTDEGCDKVATRLDEGDDNKKKNKVKNKVKNKNECSYVSDIAPTRFTPPTVEEVKAYCTERKNYIDAEHFVAYYDSVGWTVGKNRPMKDWRGAVRNWEQRDKERNAAKPAAAVERPAPTVEDVERMKRFLASMKEDAG